MIETFFEWLAQYGPAYNSRNWVSMGDVPLIVFVLGIVVVGAVAIWLWQLATGIVGKFFVKTPTTAAIGERRWKSFWRRLFALPVWLSFLLLISLVVFNWTPTAGQAGSGITGFFSGLLQRTVGNFAVVVNDGKVYSGRIEAGDGITTTVGVTSTTPTSATTAIDAATCPGLRPISNMHGVYGDGPALLATNGQLDWYIYADPSRQGAKNLVYVQLCILPSATIPTNHAPDNIDRIIQSRDTPKGGKTYELGLTPGKHYILTGK